MRDIKNLPDNGHLYAAHVIHDLWKATDGKAIVVTDVGQHQMWEAQYLQAREPRTLITSGGLGTMGFALPAAIGAKFACPDKEVWVIAGDGGFQMTAAELSTAAQEELDLNIAIVNNGYLGMVRQWQEFFYEQNYQSTPLLSPDFVKLAEAHGIAGKTVKNAHRGRAGDAGGAQTQGTVRDQLPGGEGRLGVPDDSGGSALHEMIRRPEESAGRDGADKQLSGASS